MGVSTMSKSALKYRLRWQSEMECRRNRRIDLWTTKRKNSTEYRRTRI